jgi:hypothetical protein
MNANPKARGGINHVISQLTIKGHITPDDAEHLKREIGYGRIHGFRHLAEYCSAWGWIGNYDYNQIVEYGKKFGESYIRPFGSSEVPVEKDN